MNERGQYGRGQHGWIAGGRQVIAGDTSSVKTFGEGALVGGILVGFAALMLRHAVHTRSVRLVAEINRGH